MKSSRSQVSLVLLVLLSIAGCAPAVSYPVPSPAPPTPTPTPFAGPEALPDASTPVKPALPLKGLPGQLIFIEVQEERVTKSGGQTTSFAGEQVTYSFNPETGVLKGTLQGPLDPDTQVIVGHLIINQINQNKAVSGQLYALTSELLLPIAFTVIKPTGTVCFTYEGQEHCLQPGQEISFQARETDGGELEAGQTSRTIIVINHGLLSRMDLQ